MEICIDFDGTCVTHEFPKVGKDIGAVPVLKRLIEHGHNLILFTMRSDIDNPKSEEYGIIPKGGKYLTDAVNWFKENGIDLYGINMNPTQQGWTHSPKAYAQLYIDDAALGCPLSVEYIDGQDSRTYVDWESVESHLESMGLFPEPACRFVGTVNECKETDVVEKDCSNCSYFH